MSWWVEYLAVTIGAGRRNPVGSAVPLRRSTGLRSRLTPTEVLALELEKHNGPEATWCPSVFRGNHRSSANWLAASATCADVDFCPEGRHSGVPEGLLERIVPALEGAPAALLHLTPRGFRLIDACSAPITDRKTLSFLLGSLVDDAASWLQMSGLSQIGFRVDAAASKDVARFFWAPCTTVDGSNRHSLICRTRGAS